MKRWRALITFCVIFLFSSTMSHAAGLIARQQQMKAMKQQQMQMQLMQERQAYLQYQQAILMQQQQQQQQAPAPPTYQQKVEERNQALAQAINGAHHSPVAADEQTPAQPANTAKADVPKDAVDLAEVWKKLDKRSTVWTLLVDNQAKLLTVSEYIERFQKQGVRINKDPMYYVGMIDQMVTQNSDMLHRPFWELLQMAAIMEYDFDNGMDKDLLAKHILGQAGFESNKKRLSQ
jgi:hypothetical protein